MTAVQIPYSDEDHVIWLKALQELLNGRHGETVFATAVSEPWVLVA